MGGLTSPSRTRAFVRLEPPPNREACYPRTAEIAYMRRVGGRQVIDLTAAGVRVPADTYEFCSIVSEKMRAADGTCAGESIDATLDGCSNATVVTLQAGVSYILEALPEGGARVRAQ